MKKYRIQEVAKLLADKTHAIYCDINEYELLRKVLKLAFPDDIYTDKFEFDDNDVYYGYCKHESSSWANVGSYLEELQIIKLSDILNLKLKESDIETVTISKEDYDRFLELEKKSKKSDQKFLDKCAISAMNALIITEKHSAEYIVSTSLKLSNEMLNERNKNK